MANIAKDMGLFLQKIGLLDVIIPFALTFIILFSVLQKTKVLGKHDEEPKTKINMIVAMVCGFLIIAYADTVAVVNRIAQYGIVLLITALLVVIIITFTGGDVSKVKETKLAKIIGGLIFISFAAYVLGIFEWVDKSNIETGILIPVIAVLSFIVMIYLIFKPRTEKEEENIKETTSSPETPELEERPHHK